MQNDVGDPGSPTVREAQLAEVMNRLALGDMAALFDLRSNFEAELARAVRSVASRRGARLTSHEVGDLVTDLAVELAHHAAAWRPDGGAPPWVWAHHRVGAVVDRHIGQYASSLDDERARELVDTPAAPPSSGRDRAVREMFTELAADHPLVAILLEALGLVAYERDVQIFFEISYQAANGDPSPANTVADLFEMQPTAIRQQHSRVRRRLRELAATEPRFAPLADLPLVA